MLRNIKHLLLSLFTVFKHLFKRPVTLEYPEKKIESNEHFRGKPSVNKDCVKCATCTRVCPTGAIKIYDNNFEIDMKKCIFCGNCSYYCPKNAIKMTECYELATENVEELKLVYDIESEKEGENERSV